MWETQAGGNAFLIWSSWTCSSLLLCFCRKQPSSYTSLRATFAQTATAFKQKTSFIANRDGHPRAWGLPGQQRAPALAPVDRSHGTAGRSPSLLGTVWYPLMQAAAPPLPEARWVSGLSLMPHCLFFMNLSNLHYPSALCLSVRLAWNRLAGSEVVGVAQIYGGDWVRLRLIL